MIVDYANVLALVIAIIAISVILAVCVSVYRVDNARLVWLARELVELQARLDRVEYENRDLRYQLAVLQTCPPVVCGQVKFDSEGGFSCN